MPLSPLREDIGIAEVLNMLAVTLFKSSLERCAVRWGLAVALVELEVCDWY